MATTNPTNTTPVLLALPPTMPLVALSAALAPLGLALHWRPDPRPRAPQNGRRAVVGGIQA